MTDTWGLVACILAAVVISVAGLTVAWLRGEFS
jgi:hypothetical protein